MRLIFAPMINANAWCLFLCDELGNTYALNTNNLEYDVTPMVTGYYNFIGEYHIYYDVTGMLCRELTRILYFADPMFLSLPYMELGTVFTSSKYAQASFLPQAAMDSLPNSVEFRNTALAIAKNNIHLLVATYGPAAQFLADFLHSITLTNIQTASAIKSETAAKIETKPVSEIKAAIESKTETKIEPKIEPRTEPKDNPAIISLNSEIEKLREELLRVKATPPIIKQVIKQEIIPDPAIKVLNSDLTKLREELNKIKAGAKLINQPTKEPVLSKSPFKVMLAWAYQRATATGASAYQMLSTTVAENTQCVIKYSTLGSINWLIFRAAEYNELVDRRQLMHDQRSILTPNTINISLCMLFSSIGYLYLTHKLDQPKPNPLAATARKETLRARPA